MTMRSIGVSASAARWSPASTAPAPAVLAQTTEPATRESAIEQAQAEKTKNLHPYVVSKAEQLMGKVNADPGRHVGEVAPVLRQRLFRGRLRVWRRLLAIRQPSAQLRRRAASGSR